MDDAFEALTNIEVMPDDEHEAAELLFDADAFEEPPIGAKPDDFDMEDQALQNFKVIAAELRAGYDVLAE